MVVFMKENGMKNYNDMVLELSSGRMVQSILGTGKTMWRVVMERSDILMMISMRGTGRMIKLMAMANIGS